MRKAACRWCINIYCSTRFYDAMMLDQFGAVNFGKITTLNN